MAGAIYDGKWQKCIFSGIGLVNRLQESDLDLDSVSDGPWVVYNPHSSIMLVVKVSEVAAMVFYAENTSLEFLGFSG